MKRRMTIIAAALAAIDAGRHRLRARRTGLGRRPWTGSGLRPRSRDMRGATPEQMSQYRTQRLAELKGALKLQPNQVAAWDAYEAKLPPPSRRA